jgi:lipoprotein-anchoring transpeptidase ErfK/SrfK
VRVTIVLIGVALVLLLVAVAMFDSDRGGFSSGLRPLEATRDSTGFPVLGLSIPQPDASQWGESISAIQTVPRPLAYDTGGVRTLVVSRTEQSVTVYDENGRLVDRFLCATGIYYPVPGAYTVSSRKPSGSSPDDGSRFKFFTVFAHSHRGVSIGFHSIPVDARGNLLGGLGAPISHGCVRLEEEKAQFLYDWAVDGTRVVVYR